MTIFSPRGIIQNEKVLHVQRTRRRVNYEDHCSNLYGGGARAASESFAFRAMRPARSATVFLSRFPARSSVIWAGYTCRFGHVYAPDGERLDECVATVFAAPHSFTGEDVVELSCHGGLFVLKAVLQAVFAAGAVSAAPGEFTRRCVFKRQNGPCAGGSRHADHLRAGARSDESGCQAGHDGALSRRIEKLRSDLTDIGAHLAAVGGITRTTTFHRWMRRC